MTTDALTLEQQAALEAALARHDAAIAAALAVYWDAYADAQKDFYKALAAAGIPAWVVAKWIADRALEELEDDGGR